MQLTPDSPLRQVTHEIESHVADAGWDQQPRLYALVPTAHLLAEEPGLAEQLGVDGDLADGAMTPIEQELDVLDRSFEDTLGAIMWPEQVIGCAAVVERIMLPPEAEDDLPADSDAMTEYVASHPDRREVRIVAAAVRDGQRHSVLRARGPDDAELLEGPDLVPTLLELLQHTLSD